MRRDARHTLLLPFEKGLLPYPQAGERYCFANALALPTGEYDWRAALDCIQGFRPFFVELEKAGFNVKPELHDACYDGALLLAGKHKRLNEANLVKLWNRLKPGKVLAVAGDKTVGIASLRKFAGARVAVDESLSKHHAVVFWITRGQSDWDEPQAVSAPVAGFQTGPGMFSADRIDPGSALLAEHFDARIKGNVADFGAGWGYLSARLLEQCPAIRQLDLYEADWASLEAAKANTKPYLTSVRSDAFWIDLASEQVARRYDWIVMNPPFHAGRRAETSLGVAFISAAQRNLVKGGRLLMVANRNLPYEAELRQGFSRFEIRTVKGGFKVIEAIV